MRILGELLGNVLRAHEGTPLFDLVEEVRAHSKRARLGHEAEGQALRERLAKIPSKDALPLARAFAHFLGLANVAEQHHRARSYLASEPALVRTIRAAVAKGVPGEVIVRALAAQSIELVLTAHPTQVVRRTVRMQHRAIDHALGVRDGLGAHQKDVSKAELGRRVALLWHMDDVRRRKPTPVDEVNGALVLFEQVLWDAIPRHLRQVDAVVRAELGIDLGGCDSPIRFASWVGGDRDGNPNVTAVVTREATLRARWIAARLWQKTLGDLRDELAVVSATESFRQRAHGEREPYRDVLSALMARFAKTERFCDAALEALHAGKSEPDAPEGALFDARDLHEVLDACDASLREVGLGAIADGALLDSRRRARCFGVVLAPLDVRQDSGVHAAVMDAITQAIGAGSYLAWDEARRMEFLRAELASPRHLLPRAPIDRDDVRELFATLAAIRRGGPGAFGAYVISMAKEPSDVLAVLLLQREAGIAPMRRVVPLFETLDDLDRAPRVVGELLAEPAFLEHCAGRIEIMVGYSDSAKDAGRMGSSWAIHRALEHVSQIVRARGLEPVFFHGRGGTVGRGGAPIRDSMLSMPRGTLRGDVRVTVQGESIDSTLGLETIAVQSLDLYVASVLEAVVLPPPAVDPAWRAEMDRLAAGATRAYRSVVHDDPDFVPYFRAVTPERELGLIHAGSRPARRKATDDVASLRAIPWVFAWNQVRLMIPSWLGVGDAVAEALSDPTRSETLTTMSREWPFFRSLLSLVSMSIAKGDVAVAHLYEQQLVPSELRALGEQLRERFDATSTALAHVGGHSELLEDDPLLQSSIAARNPYVDPLNILQAELLRRVRAGDEDPVLVEALLVTVNGIAAGLRNTG